MFRLFIIGGIVYLLTTKKPKSETAAELFPPTPGGKNLAFDNLPINEYGLPIALHVYESDFPLKYGDSGNVIAVLKTILGVKDIVTMPINNEFDDSLRYAIFSDTTSLDAFIQIATTLPPIVGKVEVYEFKPGA